MPVIRLADLSAGKKKVDGLLKDIRYNLELGTHLAINLKFEHLVDKKSFEEFNKKFK